MPLYAVLVSSYDYDGDEIWAVYEDGIAADLEAEKIVAQGNRSAWVDTVDLVTKNLEKA